MLAHIKGSPSFKTLSPVEPIYVFICGWAYSLKGKKQTKHHKLETKSPSFINDQANCPTTDDLKHHITAAILYTRVHIHVCMYAV